MKSIFVLKQVIPMLQYNVYIKLIIPVPDPDHNPFISMDKLPGKKNCWENRHFVFCVNRHL